MPLKMENSDLEKPLESPELFKSAFRVSSITPPVVDNELGRLSPILFEETSLEQLWSNKPSQNRLTHLEDLVGSQPISLKKLKGGLKLFSWKIKEIVERKGSSTYSEVAKQLLKDLKVPNKDNSLQNLKRRVYDAINVLVAAHVIRKQGKNVLPASPDDIQSNLYKKNSFYNEKRAKLRSLAKKYVGLKNLLERNQMQSKDSQTVLYPFCVIAMDKKTKFDVSVTKGSNAVIDIHGYYKILCDDGVLDNIGLSRKSNDLPQELLALCQDQ